MAARRKKKNTEATPTDAPAEAIVRRTPRRFYLQRLSDGGERAVRCRGREDGFRDQALADFFGSGPDLSVQANMRSMESLLGEVLENLDLEENIGKEILESAWKKVAGPGLASMSELLSVARQTACICVRHPAVHYELKRLKPRIIQALNDELGAGSVRYLRITTR